jgi:hypothetical protein
MFIQSRNPFNFEIGWMVSDLSRLHTQSRTNICRKNFDFSVFTLIIYQKSDSFFFFRLSLARLYFGQYNVAKCHKIIST